jgi:hypothetical protein
MRCAVMSQIPKMRLEKGGTLFNKEHKKEYNPNNVDANNRRFIQKCSTLVLSLPSSKSDDEEKRE